MDDLTSALSGSTSNGRRPSGTAAFALGSSPTDYAGTLVREKNSAAGDPTAPGTATAPSPMMGQELGASYKIAPHIDRGTMDPSTGPTQGNGRLIKSAVNRSNQNFFSAV